MFNILQKRSFAFCYFFIFWKNCFYAAKVMFENRYSYSFAQKMSKILLMRKNLLIHDAFICYFRLLKHGKNMLRNCQMVFCYHNCSNVLWEKIVSVWGKKVNREKVCKFEAVRPRICNVFEIHFSFQTQRTSFFHSKLEILW